MRVRVRDVASPTTVLSTVLPRYGGGRGSSRQPRPLDGRPRFLGRSVSASGPENGRRDPSRGQRGTRHWTLPAVGHSVRRMSLCTWLPRQTAEEEEGRDGCLRLVTVWDEDVTVPVMFCDAQQVVASVSQTQTLCSEHLLNIPAAKPGP